MSAPEKLDRLGQPGDELCTITLTWSQALLVMGSFERAMKGGMTLAEFAALHSMPVKTVLRFAKTGLIIGANRDSRSKKWYIYPPATLLRTVGKYTPRKPSNSAASPDLLPCGSADIGEAGTDSGQSGQYAPQVKAAGIHPPASQPFDAVPQLPEPLPPAPMPEIYSCAKVRRACHLFRQEVTRRYAEGVRYLTLDERELRQLRHAVEQERNRKRVAVGRGHAQIGELRATDSLWQKLCSAFTPAPRRAHEGARHSGAHGVDIRAASRISVSISEQTP